MCVCACACVRACVRDVLCPPSVACTLTVRIHSSLCAVFEKILAANLTISANSSGGGGSSGSVARQQERPASYAGSIDSTQRVSSSHGTGSAVRSQSVQARPNQSQESESQSIESRPNQQSQESEQRVTAAPERDAVVEAKVPAAVPSRDPVVAASHEQTVHQQVTDSRANPLSAEHAPGQASMAQSSKPATNKGPAKNTQQRAARLKGAGSAKASRPGSRQKSVRKLPAAPGGSKITRHAKGTSPQKKRVGNTAGPTAAARSIKQSASVAKSVQSSEVFAKHKSELNVASGDGASDVDTGTSTGTINDKVFTKDGTRGQTQNRTSAAQPKAPVSMAQYQAKISSKDKTVIDVDSLADALAHTNSELRRRVIGMLNEAILEDDPLAVVLVLLAKLKCKDALKPYQSVAAVLASISSINFARHVNREDFNTRRMKMLPMFFDVLISTELEDGVRGLTCNAAHNLGLTGFLVLRLIDRIEEKYRTASVHCELVSLQAAGLADWNGVKDMQIADRLVALLPHFSRVKAEGTATSEMDVARSLINSLPLSCFTIKLLETIERALQALYGSTSKAATHDPTQHLQLSYLQLLTQKYAAVLGLNLQHEENNGAIFSTVQDYLLSPRLELRLEACRFIKTLSKGDAGAIYSKAITHQLLMQLEADEDFQRRCALTVAIAFCFEPSAMLSALLKRIETGSERCRQVAVIGLYNKISNQRFLPKEIESPFRTLDG